VVEIDRFRGYTSADEVVHHKSAGKEDQGNDRAQSSNPSQDPCRPVATMRSSNNPCKAWAGCIDSWNRTTKASAYLCLLLKFLARIAASDEMKMPEQVSMDDTRKAWLDTTVAHVDRVDPWMIEADNADANIPGTSIRGTPCSILWPSE
jgi:hypothetical protein